MRTGDAMNKSFYILLHPWFLFALLVLIVNDHFLKVWYPSFISGKLSDFAGLFVFPVCLLAVFRPHLSTRRSLVLLHLSVALAFTVWKLAPVEMLLSEIHRTFSIPVPTRVKDPLDLAALIVLPLSFLFLRKQLKTRGRPSLHRAYHEIAGFLAMVVAWYSIVATSIPLYEPSGYACCEETRGNVDGDEAGEINVADAVYLVAFLYSGGVHPQCVAEGDVDGSGDKNPIREQDLIYLVNYLFRNGPPPPECPH